MQRGRWLSSSEISHAFSGIYGDFTWIQYLLCFPTCFDTAHSLPLGVGACAVMATLLGSFDAAGKVRLLTYVSDIATTSLVLCLARRCNVLITSLSLLGPFPLPTSTFPLSLAPVLNESVPFCPRFKHLSPLPVQTVNPFPDRNVKLDD